MDLHLRPIAAIAALVLFAAACTSDGDTTTAAPDDPTSSTTAPPGDVIGLPAEVGITPGVGRTFPPAPEVPTNDTLDPETQDAFDFLASTIALGGPTASLVDPLADTGDPRFAWAFADLMRFYQGGDGQQQVLIDAIEGLTGMEIDRARAWPSATDHLIAWDLPAPPGYQAWKVSLFSGLDARWRPLIEDPESEIDYRWLNWGGVLIDDRALGTGAACPRGCIPALDDPAVTPASEGDWYPDDAIVFGVVINGEARAYPKHQMEVHEMVNDTLGGRRFGMPYCTLCGSAQVFLTDELDADIAERPPVLRTSGLLSRSNKVMYDLDSRSVFDTFTGEAVTGPLRAAGVVLPQETVVTTTWSAWKAAHPETTILAENGGLGRTYDLDPLQGRDDNGPIFPVGDVDARLEIQEQVVGVIIDDRIVAFPAEAARGTLTAGGTVEFDGITLELDGGDVLANADGEPVASHQAFWFAWSQFHPDTELWLP